jgi:hypothetical protein
LDNTARLGAGAFLRVLRHVRKVRLWRIQQQKLNVHVGQLKKNGLKSPPPLSLFFFALRVVLLGSNVYFLFFALCA